MERGMIQVYTGNGKGKSTAAFGFALRALGRGLRVEVIQFLKGEESGERKAFARAFPEVGWRYFGRPGFIRGKPSPEDCRRVEEGLAWAWEVAARGKANLLILDEINNALSLGLLSLERVVTFLKEKPPSLEVVLTGRNAPLEIIALADLVTEMHEIKHPYQQGIGKRKGIEY